MSEQNELLDTYDVNGCHLGPQPSWLVHQEGLWHRTFHCLVTDTDEAKRTQVLLQRRGRGKREFPNHLDVSVSGHYRTGEAVEGGIREAQEELGIMIDEEGLVSLAERSVNERTTRGGINREVQDIYWFHLTSMNLRELPIGFPEVEGVVRCDLDSLEQFLTDKSFILCGESISGPQGPPRKVRCIQVRRGDLIPEAFYYWRLALAQIKILATTGKYGGNDECRLRDGSIWQPQSGP